MAFERVRYKDLNAKQQEACNFQKSAALLADYGFNCLKLADDWQGADFLAYHKDGDQTLKVQLKGRVTIARKYQGRDIWMNFPASGGWYLIEHDELLRIVGEATNWLNTRSWTERGGYSSGTLSTRLRDRLQPYRIGDAETRC